MLSAIDIATKENKKKTAKLKIKEILGFINGENLFQADLLIKRKKIIIISLVF